MALTKVQKGKRASSSFQGHNADFGLSLLPQHRWKVNRVYYCFEMGWGATLRCWQLLALWSSWTSVTVQWLHICFVLVQPFTGKYHHHSCCFSLVREVATEHSFSSSSSHSHLLLPAPPQWRLMLEESSGKELLGQTTTFTWTLEANSSPNQSWVPWGRAKVVLQPSPAEQRLRLLFVPSSHLLQFPALTLCRTIATTASMAWLKCRLSVLASVSGAGSWSRFSPLAVWTSANSNVNPCLPHSTDEWDNCFSLQIWQASNLVVSCPAQVKQEKSQLQKLWDWL